MSANHSAWATGLHISHVWASTRKLSLLATVAESYLCFSHMSALSQETCSFVKGTQQYRVEIWI